MWENNFFRKYFFFMDSFDKIFYEKYYKYLIKYLYMYSLYKVVNNMRRGQVVQKGLMKSRIVLNIKVILLIINVFILVMLVIILDKICFIVLVIFENEIKI